MGSRPGEDNPISGLPEEWGRIVVPDDPAELEELAAEVRDELGLDEDESLERRQRRLPFIVIAVTVAIALVSLFTVPWLGRVGQMTPPGDPVSATVDSEAGCGASTTRCASPGGSRGSSRAPTSNGTRSPTGTSAADERMAAVGHR